MPSRYWSELVCRCWMTELMAVPAALANMVLLGCLFGRQNMRLVMVQICFVNVTNLCLNVYFVMGLGMAIEGVAWASVAAQWIGFLGTLALVRWQWRDLLNGIAGRVFMRRPAWLDHAAFGRWLQAHYDHIFTGSGDAEAVVARLAARRG